MRSICIYSGFCICKLDIVLLESQSKASIILHWFQNMSWKTEVRPRFFFRISLRNTMACPGFFFFRINLQNTEVRPRPRQSCRSGPVELCLCPSPTWFQRNFINDSLVIKVQMMNVVRWSFLPWRSLAHPPRLAAPPTLWVVLLPSLHNLLCFFIRHLR